MTPPPPQAALRRAAGALFDALRRYWRWILLIGGFAAVVGMVLHVGAAAVGRAIVLAGPWLPIIIMLDFAWMGIEALGLLFFYGPRGRAIPTSLWLRGMMVHFSTMVMLPVGRAGAEVARAALLAPVIGSQRAAAGAAQFQAIILLANAVICLPCLVAAIYGVGLTDTLTGLLAINCAGTAAVGLGLYIFLRNVRLGGWLGERFRRMAHWGPGLDEAVRESPAWPWAPLGLGVLGRAVQTLQYGLILLAVGGNLTVVHALLTQGIHLVAAFFGDFVPNAAGIAEAAYAVFAYAVELAHAPEKALAIAIVARISSFSVAGLCFVTVQLWSSRTREPMNDYAPQRTVAERLAREAGRLTIELREKGLSVQSKGVDDLVTNVDVAVETFVKEQLRATFPEAGLIGEELGSETEGAAHRWVIDPVDGTLNLAHGICLTSVSLALEVDGEAVLGVIYHPDLDELFSAVKGHGAFLNGERIAVSQRNELTKAVIAAKPTRPHLPQFNAAARSCRDIRRFGTAALELAYVACGRLDGFFEYGLLPWDTAAGVLVVSEAGGQISDDVGGAFRPESACLVATNAVLHRPLLTCIAGD